MNHHRTTTGPHHHARTRLPGTAGARVVTAGIDGSMASMDAADWAAREALLHGVPLRLLHAGTPTSAPPARVRALPGAERGRGVLDRAAITLSYVHPALEIHAQHPSGPTVAALLAASAAAGTLVLGSRGRAGAPGLAVGSVAAAVSARASAPVVLVRAGERPEDARTPAADGTPSQTMPHRPVVLGLDPWRSGDAPIAYAFDAAAARGAPLHVVHAWTMAALDACAPDRVLPSDLTGLERRSREALGAALAPWRRTHPRVTVVERVGFGRAGHRLLMAATGASLLVIGRRGGPGAHLGRTAHSALDHVTCPVAVVPHD
ncbi:MULTISPECIES: universal stress protein [Streptomyces]|uniref:Stress-inducible protein n=2 Tax=Streptomyces TaxID=1883 RepID=A0A0W7X5N8_9ACTN|nr:MULTISPECIES: universal stress protein [Streptomyces]KUF18214.1 stress-inducible protein [Streptomyces silvensis]MVO88084.1 universal stress protein [Streptomyces typhae]